MKPGHFSLTVGLLASCVLTTAACGNLGTHGGDAAAVSSIELSSASLYQQLTHLPASGAGSLSALYTELGAMTFKQFFTYQVSHAPAVTLSLDGKALPNPRQALLANEAKFTAAAAYYPTVGAWWRATGATPGGLPAEAVYAADLDSALGATKASLGLVTSDDCAVMLAMMAASWMGSSSSSVSSSSSSASSSGSILPVSTSASGVDEGASSSANGGRGGPTQPIPIPLSQRYGLRSHAQAAAQQAGSSDAGSNSDGLVSSADVNHNGYWYDLPRAASSGSGWSSSSFDSDDYCPYPNVPQNPDAKGKAKQTDYGD